MKSMTRRDFLGAAAATAAGLALAGWPRRAHASPAWGDLPPGTWTTPPDLKVLQIHLLGGVAPFESFYYQDSIGRRTRGFDTEITDLVWNTGCGSTPTGLELMPGTFGTDGLGKAIRLGPFAKPLWDRPDIRDRMRVIVQTHNLLPHEAAIPLALSGLRLGNPNQANLGAAIAHRYLAMDAEAGLPPRTLPYAYGLVSDTAGLNSLLTSMMGAVGRHPGSARPLVLKIGPGFATFITQLGRSNMSAAKDALLDQYRGQYRDWLRQGGTGPVTRSNGFRDYDTSAGALLNAADFSAFLGTVPTSVPTEAECARDPALTFESRPNPTKTALQAAVFLLTRPPAERARYVCVIDSGIEPRFSLPYDVHNFNHPGDTGSNLWNTFRTLSELINDPLAAADPDKLSLNDTLIVITTEFGRTPYKSLGGIPDATSVGRDHWPQAYTNILIGGPITSRGVAGSINDGLNELAVADLGFTPTDVHAAALLAAGISPFESENYAVGQLTGSLQGIDHPTTLNNLKTTLLGL
jgi:hypothetical protein